MNKRWRLQHAFLESDEGNVTIFTIFVFMIILTITGASVDIARSEAVRAAMQSTLDRAVLAAADLDQKQDPKAVVADYMAKAGIPDVLASVRLPEEELAADDPFAVLPVNSRVVTAAAYDEIDTFFLRLSGFDDLGIQALSTAEEKIANVEISLVLDISGSMRYDQRMARMRPAAQDFVRKVMTDDSNGVTTLNLVPYAGSVNPGDTLFDYFRGERPDLPEEPDVPVVDPEPETPQTDDGDYFEPWAQAISNAVFYFDIDGDGITDVFHKIQGFPENAPRDLDDLYKGAVAYFMDSDSDLSDPAMFLGASIKGGKQTTRYFQVLGDENGPESDLGWTYNTGKAWKKAKDPAGEKGKTVKYKNVDFDDWEQSYVSPNIAVLPEQAADEAHAQVQPSQPVNMPNSCVEIYDEEFDTTDLPKSSDFIPHFNYWPYDEEVMDWGWCPSEMASVQYYSSDRESLVDYIGQIRMHDGTGIQYGMKYALALLDPGNQSEVAYLIEQGHVDARFKGRPIQWNDPETEKFIVLMTDGQTTDQYRPNDPLAPTNGEIALKDQGSGSHFKFETKNNNISNLQKQCALARENGVTVFTIAFETNSAATADMLECASSPSHFLHVTGTQIFDAFDTVARQINNLRLIQ